VLGCDRGQPVSRKYSALPVLAPGSPAAGPIRSGESRSFAIFLQADQYLRAAVEQKGIDVELTLLGPSEDRLATGGPVSRQGMKVLSMISSTAGTYCLRLSVPAGEAAPGRYRLAIAELRAANSRDKSRIAAQEKLAEGLRARDRSRDLHRALARLEEALPLWRAAKDVEGEVDTTNEIGATEFYLGQLDAARGRFEAALALGRRAGYVRGQADAWNDLGAAFVRLHQPKAGLEAYRNALAIWKHLRDPLEQATTLTNIGDVSHKDLYDLDQANRSFTEALALRRAVGDEKGEAFTLTGLGLIAQGQGDLTRALNYFGDALELSRKTGDRRNQATIRSNMAGIYLYRGELQKALEAYDAALANDGPGDMAEAARIAHNLASLYFALGEPEKALTRYQQVLKQQRDDPASGAFTLNSIGAVLSALNRTGEAGLELARAMTLSRDAPDSRALTLHNLGQLHLILGQKEQALEELQRALVLREKLPDLAGRATTLLAVGTAFGQLHHSEQAAASFRKALALARQVHARSLISRCLLLQAMFDRDRGDLGKAYREIQEALGVVETVRRDVGTDELRTSYFAAQRSYYDVDVDLLMRLAERHRGREYWDQALKASEQARARGLLDLLAEGKIDVNRGVDPALKQREAALTSEIVWTEGQLKQARQAAVPDEAAARRLEERLQEIDRQQQALIGEIRSRNPRYAEVSYPPALDARKIEEQLDGHTALLEYAVSQEATLLFVVTHEGLAAHRLPLGAGALAERVGRLRRALQNPGRSLRGNYLQEAADLYRDLVAPAASSLEGKRTLLVSPDGILHLLPFEALLTEVPKAGEPDSGLPFLLRRHAIAYVPSATVLKRLSEPRPAPAAGKRRDSKAFLAFANPAYRAQGRGSPELPLLPGSEQEVRTIASLYPPGDVRLYMGSEATKDNVIGNPLLEKSSRVHFATHGFLDEQRPQLSSLALALGRAKGDDGFLRVHEIFDLKLNADLVVLSACETSGTQVTGEGLVGLTRAFFYAGASSLMVSLWRAQDASTPELMASFYGQLKRGKAEALQAAKLEMIEKGRYAHPSYWAPFILVGDPH
jgi:CHAT domain-containing protein/tetratricopeptide (TPR) repeat protein